MVITFLFPVQLGPNVSIGTGVTIGAGVRVRESIILHGATLQVNMQQCFFYLFFHIAQHQHQTKLNLRVIELTENVPVCCEWHLNVLLLTLSTHFTNDFPEMIFFLSSAVKQKILLPMSLTKMSFLTIWSLA